MFEPAHDLHHSEGVQCAIFLQVLAHAATLGGVDLTEGHAEKFTGCRAAFLNRQFFVALAGERREDGFHGVAAVLVRVVVAEAAKREQQVHHTRRHFAQPRFELRQQFATFLQPPGFKTGVVGDHRAGSWQSIAQAAHEFRAGVGCAIGEKVVMLWLGVGRTDYVQGVLKRDLLVGAGVIKQRDGCADGLEVEIADGIFELAEKRGERGAVNVRLAGEQDGTLDSLIIGERDVGGNVGQFLDALLEQRKTFRAAAVKGEHAGLGQERPAAIVQGTGVGIVTMRADLYVGMRLQSDDTLHGVNLILDVAGHRGDGLGDVFQGEEFLWINRAVPDELTVDMGEETFAQPDARAADDERLKGDVRQVNFLLQAGGGFHFDQIPCIAGARHEDIGVGVTAAVGESGFVNGPALFDCFLRALDCTVEIAGSGINLDAAGKQLFGQFAHLVALIKDGLLRFVRLWDLVLGVVAKPKELRALPPHQERGFGEGWEAGWLHGCGSLAESLSGDNGVAR